MEHGPEIPVRGRQGTRWAKDSWSPNLYHGHYDHRYNRVILASDATTS